MVDALSSKLASSVANLKSQKEKLLWLHLEFKQLGV